MVNKWIDKKTSLRAGKKIILRGEIVPDGVLSEKRLKFFKSRKMIESVLDKREMEIIKKQAEKEAEKEALMEAAIEAAKEKADKKEKIVSNFENKKMSKKEKRAFEKMQREKTEIIKKSSDDLMSSDDFETGAVDELE